MNIVTHNLKNRNVFVYNYSDALRDIENNLHVNIENLFE